MQLNCFFLPFNKKSTQKGNNFLSDRVKFFPFKVDSFQMERVQESIQEVTKVVSCGSFDRKSTKRFKSS